MKILKDAITALASEGRCTLQVPDVVISLDANPPLAQTEDVPDDWFVTLKYEGYKLVPSVGNQGGFLFLSRKGYEANKAKLKKAFASKRNRGNVWALFEEQAEKHFAEVEANTVKKLKKLKAQVAELERFVP